MSNLFPDECSFYLNYCYYLYECMAKFVIQGEKEGLFWEDINLNKEELEVFQNLPGDGDDIFNWLICNGHSEQANKLMFKQVFVAILSDYLEYLHDALLSSKNGHLSVTFSLLRKPLKDDLFILESLVYEPEVFLNNFYSEKSYELIAIDKQIPEEKKRIIAGAISKIGFSHMPPEAMYEMRYSKNGKLSYEKEWQRASHIVTSCEHYRTEKGQLNIYSPRANEDNDLWKYLYFTLPNIIFYSYQIVSYLYYKHVNKKDKKNENEMDTIIIGMIIAERQILKNKIPSVYDELTKDITLKCHKCGSLVKYNEKNEKRIFIDGYYLCNKNHRSYLFEIQKDA